MKTISRSEASKILGKIPVHCVATEDEVEALAKYVHALERENDQNLDRLVAAREAWDRWNEGPGNSVAQVVLIGELLGAKGEPRGS